MKLFKKTVLSFVALTLSLMSAKAIGWPANYEGVMLQGFYWDSYTETSWKSLENQSDELSKYFKLIWVPNSAKSEGNPSMGYHPIYWFTNHNSSFGTETELRSMIKTFKDKGTGIIADVVINHRSGVSNWTNFPTEKWNGTTYSIGLDGICRTDEVNGQAGQGTPTGAADTGENWSGSRDLDHTNANVQKNCKAYIKCLLEDFGYSGCRYDFVKGYAPQYTKMYNEANNVTYSVGECWDGNYDTVKAWIEGTGKTSAAFDFPCKYAINEAFSSNDMTKLVWKAYGTTNQPAGMIHAGYSQYAVTFIDNHDTYRDGSKFTSDKVVAANAFILCSPGTPCVFYPHWKANKAEIKKLIDIRNTVGIHNNSAVNVLQSSNNCYMAEVTGTKGKLVVKIGSAMTSPSGYSDSDIKASGDYYCVWTKASGGDIPDPIPDPDGSMYILGNLAGEAGWGTTPGTGVAMTQNGSVYTAKNVEFIAAADKSTCFFNITDYVGTTWDDLNEKANRYGAADEGEAITVGTPAKVTAYLNNVSASGCQSWAVAPGKYDVTFDKAAMTVTLTKAGTDPDPIPDPSDFTIYYDNSNTSWSAVYIHYWDNPSTTWPGTAMTKVEGNIWKYTFPSDPSKLKGFLFGDGNSAGGNGHQTDDYTSVPVKNHLYKGANANKGAVSDEGVYEGGHDVPDGEMYILGNLAGEAGWGTTPGTGVAMTQSGSVYTAKDVEFIAAAGESKCFFNITDYVGKTWDDLNEKANRYGAADEGEAITVGTPAKVTAYLNNISASGCKSWAVAPGKYNVTFDKAAMTVTVSSPSGVETIDAADQDVTPVYYNLQGVEVDNPSNGIYIVVRGSKVTKEYIK